MKQDIAWDFPDGLQKVMSLSHWVFFSQEIGTNLNEFINNSSSNDNEKLRNARLFETVLVFCFVLFFRFCLFVFVCFCFACFVFCI